MHSGSASKTSNIQQNLIKEFPTGYFTPSNSLATTFDITSNAQGKNFYDGFTGAGSTLIIDTSVPNATYVSTLINAYAPSNGGTLGTIEFLGSGGADETFTLINGRDARDFFQGGFANTINNTTTLSTLCKTVRTAVTKTKALRWF